MILISLPRALLADEHIIRILHIDDDMETIFALTGGWGILITMRQ